MKNNLLTKALFACAMLIASLAQAVQLSGNYTINPSGTATATNFKDFASAITYMTSTTARADGGPANTGTVGVSGPVVFDVAAATYAVSATISIPTIPGTSPVNTVTFDGGAGNAATRIISGSISGPIVLFNLCKYVKMTNLSITNNAATSSCVVFFNNTTTGSSATTSPNGSCNTVSNLICNIPNASSNNSTAILTSSSTTATYYGNGTAFYGDSIVIDSNTILNCGYYGGINIYGQSGSTSYNRGIKVRNNVVNNPYYYGSMIYYVQNAIDIMYNTINCNGSTTYYGLYYYSSSAYTVVTGTTPSRVIGNKVLKYMGYGLYMAYPQGTAAAPTQVYNNMVAGSSSQSYYDCYLVMTASYYIEVLGNTFIHNGGSGYYAFYTSGTANLVAKNNLFAVMSGGTSYAAYFSTSPSPNSAVNYNNYWHSLGASATTLVYRNGQWNPSNYQNAAYGGDSSVNIQPSFANANAFDYHLSDGCAPKGVPLASVTTDIDGEARNVPPIMGCDESGGYSNDLSLTGVLAPTIPITLGLQNIVVKVKNVGNNVISNFDISYKQNNEPVVTQTWTGTLNPCDEIMLTFTGPNQINLVSSNNVKIYTSGPNSALDNKRTNDTMSMQWYAPLSGTFTVGGTNPDFANFAQATNALASGIAGPVVFDVRPGTYNEQVIIPNVAGSSPTNTVVISGQNKATTIISGNIASNPIVRLNGCKYVTVSNLTINQTNASGAGISIIGSTANNAGSCNTIKNCIVNLPSNTSTSYGISVTGTVSGFGFSNCLVDSTLIDSNIVNGGYYQIGMYGNGVFPAQAIANFNNVIRANTCNDGYQYSLYVYYQMGGPKVLYNRINMRTSGSISSQMGLYLYNYNYWAHNVGSTTITNYGKVGGQTVVNGNIFDAAYYGMYLYYLSGTINMPTLITNNIVKPGFDRYSGGGYYGAYIYQYGVGAVVTDPTPTILFYNNTIYHNGTSSGYGVYLSGDGGSYAGKMDFKNNILVSSGSYALYLGSIPNAQSTNYVDYNIFYKTNGGNVLYKNGVNYDATNVVTIAGGGLNSLYINPPFVSAKDPHISNACTKGMNVSNWIQYDVDGEQRGTFPNIGADEYPGLDRDVSVVEIVSPKFPVATGLQDLRVRIRNNGSVAINSVNLTYVMNNNAPVTLPWVGTLNPCDTVTITFNGFNQIDVPNSNNLVTIYTSNPNGNFDQNSSNDTLRSAALAPPLRGDYTIAPTGGDFNNMSSAIVAVNQRGIGGHVNFVIAPATYNEAATINLSGVIGLSDTSRLSFMSSSDVPTNTVIQTNASPIIRLNGVSYVNFRGIKFNQTTTGGSVMELPGECKFINVYNCHLIAPSTTSTSYVVNGYQNGAGRRSINFTKNRFEGCYYGFAFYPTSTTYAGKDADIICDSNVFDKVAIYNTYLFYLRDVKQRANTFNFGNGANTYGYWYGPYYCDSAFDISNNTVNVFGSYYYLYYVGYNGYGGYLPTSRAKVYNNVVNYQGTQYGYWYYWGYYGNRIDYYGNRINNLSSSNYTYIYYPGYYGNGVRYYNNSWPMNSGYFAYTGYNSGEGAKYYNNSMSSTNSSGTWYSHYSGSSSGDGFEAYNNVVANTASGPAIYTSGTLNATDKFDYNNFYTNGSTLISGGQTAANMAALKSLGYCKNCISMDPGYTNTNTNLTPNVGNTNVWSLNGQGKQYSWINSDINGNARSTQMATGAVDLGAYEFTPTAIPPAATLTPAAPPVTGGYQTVLLGQDTVARINWAGGSVPTTVTVRLYSGTNPLNVLSGNFANAYWDIAVSPAASYNYSLELYHKGIWQGSNPSAANMIGAQYNGGWQYIFSSTSNTELNKIVLSGLTNFGQFTLTDATTPFTPALMVLSDKNKQVVGTEPLTVYPNPFNSDLNVQLELSTQGTVKMNLVDITGKTIITKEQFMNQGVNRTVVEGVADMKPGIYFLTVEMNGQSFFQKLIKQ